MPLRNAQGNRETSLAKVRAKSRGRLKATELTARGRAKNVSGTVPSRSPLRQSVAKGVVPAQAETDQVTGYLWVPVISSVGKPLMPCSNTRARIIKHQ